MNNHDRSNLNFLLSVTPDVFDDWMTQADADDIDYALELLSKYRSELMVKELEVEDTVKDTSQAMNVLKGFML